MSKQELPKELEKPLTERSELSNIVKRFAKKEPWLAAENPKSPKKDLIRFSKDENPAIRLLVVNNPNTPDALVKRLLKDKDPDVRHAAGVILLGKLSRKETTFTNGELFDIAYSQSTDNLSALILFKSLRGSNVNDQK